MSHRITVKFLGFEIEPHQLGNFVEAIWRVGVDEGLLEWRDLDQALFKQTDIVFLVIPRRAPEMVRLLNKVVREHLMESRVEIVHERRPTKSDG